jgi:hypothetical protein
MPAEAGTEMVNPQGVGAVFNLQGSNGDLGIQPQSGQHEKMGKQNFHDTVVIGPKLLKGTVPAAGRIFVR